jgi:hypothetical protein
MKKIPDIGIPIGIVVFIGAIVGFFMSGLTNAIPPAPASPSSP